MAYVKCGICGDYYFDEKIHKCRGFYYGRTENEEDWEEIRGESFEDAALVFVNNYSIDSKVEIRDIYGKIKKYLVSAEKKYTKQSMINYGKRVRLEAYLLWAECNAEGYKIEFMDLPPISK